MVYVAGLALVSAPDSDGAVLTRISELNVFLGLAAWTYIRTANQLLASGRKLDVHHSRHVALLDILRLAKIPGIENVDVVIWMWSVSP
jgi:hypothetical protein